MLDPQDAEFDFEWAIVGSGFGGSVAALRLAEKGYRVGVIERGRSYEDSDLPTSTTDIERFVWAPDQGLYGKYSGTSRSATLRPHRRPVSAAEA